jgi:hypothetical protein
LVVASFARGKKRSERSDLCLLKPRRRGKRERWRSYLSSPPR